MLRPSPAINKRRRATHQWILFMTESRDVTQLTPKTTEQNLIVRIDKSEAEETNNKILRWRYCTVQANYWQTWSTRGLSARAELLVFFNNNADYQRKKRGNRFTIKSIWVKNYVEKRLLKMFMTEDEVLMG